MYVGFFPVTDSRMRGMSLYHIIDAEHRIQIELE